MYLVDTSVWIDALRQQPRAPGQRLNRLQQEDVELHLCGPVLQELLQGAKDHLSLIRLRRLFNAQRFLDIPDSAQTYAAAGELYTRCRWRGITPRSSNDCLIAQIAIENDLILLHDDHDYDRIARIEPRLMLA